MSIKRELKSRRIMKCQKCGGQLIHSYGDVGCLQCGAIHTIDGRLETINSMMNVIITEAKIGAPEPGKNHVLTSTWC